MKFDNYDSTIRTSYVHGGSMYPILVTGDKVILKKKDFRVGDIIMYKFREHHVTHRVYALSDFAITKGDNVPFLDEEPVHFDQIIGVVQGVYKKNKLFVNLSDKSLRDRLVTYSRMEIAISNFINSILGGCSNRIVKIVLSPLYYEFFTKPFKKLN